MTDPAEKPNDQEPAGDAEFHNLLDRIKSRGGDEITDEELDRIWQEERKARYREEKLAKALAEIPASYRDDIRMLPMVREWMDQFLHGGLSDVAKHSLFMSGRPGCGKTATAWQICKEAALAGVFDYRLEKVPDLLDALEPRRRDHEADPQKIARLLKVDLLLLDDLGAHRVTEWRVETLQKILDGRWEHRRPTIITTNFPGKRISVPREEDGAGLGDRISSRLGGMCRIVTFPNFDYRTGVDYSDGEG